MIEASISISFIIMLVGVCYLFFLFRKGRLKETLEVDDVEGEYPDDTIVVVPFGQNQCIRMTYFQKKYVWDELDREGKRKYLKQYATLIKGKKR